MYEFMVDVSKRSKKARQNYYKNESLPANLSS